jgi:hypothetical protein
MIIPKKIKDYQAFLGPQLSHEKNQNNTTVGLPQTAKYLVNLKSTGFKSKLEEDVRTEEIR